MKPSASVSCRHRNWRGSAVTGRTAEPVRNRRDPPVTVHRSPALRVLTVRWDAVDLERGTVRLAETKTGPKTIYLNAPALEVLNNLVRISENPFAICGEKSDSHLVNLQKPWRTVREAAGFDDVRLHHLRHTFASVGVGGGASLPMVGALLGHSQPQTTDRYAHLAADPLRAASEAIARWIAASLNDAPRKPAAPNRTPL